MRSRHPVGDHVDVAPAGVALRSYCWRTLPKNSTLSLISSTYLTLVPYLLLELVEGRVRACPVHVDVERPVGEVAGESAISPLGITFAALRRRRRRRRRRRPGTRSRSRPSAPAPRVRSSVRAGHARGHQLRRRVARRRVVRIAHCCPLSISRLQSRRPLAVGCIAASSLAPRRAPFAGTTCMCSGAQREAHARARAGQRLALGLVGVRDEHRHRRTVAGSRTTICVAVPR